MIDICERAESDAVGQHRLRTSQEGEPVGSHGCPNRCMFERAAVGEPRNRLSDWMIRGAVALIFILLGADKFVPGWISLFQQIGFGQWFRYFTGVVEIVGGLLVLVPWTVTAGLALLASTMASAALILVFVVHRPGDSPFSLAFLIGLTVVWWARRG